MTLEELPPKRTGIANVSEPALGGTSTVVV